MPEGSGHQPTAVTRMKSDARIRRSTATDRPAVEALYPAAFPEEDLLPLVRELLGDPTHTVSLVAESDAGIVGNIIFTFGSEPDSGARIALLAPLAVAPTVQGQGLGSALVRAGVASMQESGAALVCVLGDPNYYGRFGFEPERDVQPPYALPTEWQDAWQSMRALTEPAPISGTLRLPDYWLRPALWLP